MAPSPVIPDWDWSLSSLDESDIVPATEALGNNGANRKLELFLCYSRDETAWWTKARLPYTLDSTTTNP